MKVVTKYERIYKLAINSVVSCLIVAFDSLRLFYANFVDGFLVFCTFLGKSYLCSKNAIKE